MPRRWLPYHQERSKKTGLSRLTSALWDVGAEISEIREPCSLADSEIDSYRGLTVEGECPHDQRKESADKEQIFAQVPLGGPYEASLDLGEKGELRELRLRTHF
jgi:hypothetical protein